MGHDSVTYSLGLFYSLKFVKNQNHPSFYILRANKNWNWKKNRLNHFRVYCMWVSVAQKYLQPVFLSSNVCLVYLLCIIYGAHLCLSCMQVMFIQIVAHRTGQWGGGVLKPQQLSGIWSKLLVINHSSTPLPATPRYQRDHQPQVLQHRSPQRTNISGSDHTSSWGNIRFVTQSQRRGT